MIVDFFRRGTGEAGGVVDYLLGRNRDREHASVLSGDVAEVSELIDSSPYLKKYTAGCLSFYEHDLPPDQKQQIMADFENCLFPGLERGSYRVLWVQHQDKENEETGQTRLELNFLIPNVEINSGKRLQPFYAKADIDRVDCFKQITNHQYRLFDPDDPINRQATKVAKNLPKAAKELKQALETEVTLAVSSGIVTDRVTLVRWLTDIGLEVSRQTAKSLSIKNPNGDENVRPVRLTGEIYEQNFRHTQQSTELVRAASERYRREASSRYTASVSEYTRLCERKSEYHQQRYGREQYSDFAASERRYSADQAANRPTHQSTAENSAGERTGVSSATNATSRTDQGELARVERLERTNSAGREAEKSPYYIEYSLDFTSMYSSYQQHLLRLRQQQQVQRHKRDAEKSRVPEKPRGEHEYGEMWNREEMEMVRPNRPDGQAIQQQHGSNTGNQLNDTRSAVIEHHRAAAASAAERVRATRSPEWNNHTAAGLQQQISATGAVIERSKQRVNKHHQEIAEPSAITEFIKQAGERFTAAITEPFRTISQWAADRDHGKSIDSKGLAAHGSSRDQRADQTLSAGIEARSIQLERLDTRIVGTALSRLEQRREQQKAAYKAQQEQKRSDRGLDYGF